MFNKIVGSHVNAFSEVKEAEALPHTSNSSPAKSGPKLASALKAVFKGLPSENKNFIASGQPKSSNQSIPENQTFHLPAVQLNFETLKNLETLNVTVVTEGDRRGNRHMPNHSPYVLSDTQTFNQQPTAQFEPIQLAQPK